MVAIVTPMKEGNTPDTALDMDSLANLIEFHINNKTAAIVAVGTTGESATLDNTEHCKIIKQVVTLVNGRIPVIAGTGANSTTEAIHLTQCAKDAGADACLLVTPYYNKPTQDGLYLHYKIVASRVDIPQILYNVPGRTACDILPETVGKLSKIDNIIGIKDATGDINRINITKSLCTDNFLLFSGDDDTAKEFILQGGHGFISVTANIAPKAMHEMYESIVQKQYQEAENINNKLSDLHKQLFIESNPIPAKWALQKMGLIEAGIRLPLTWLAKNAEQPLIEALQKANLNVT